MWRKLDELEDIYSDIVTWLDEIDEDGGLITPADQSMMLLVLGELSKEPYAEFIIDQNDAARRAAIDIVIGIPTGIVS